MAFSDRDPGRGNAILWLTKLFGVFHLEICGPDGEIDLHDLAESIPYSGLTLIIQSVPLIEGEQEERNSTLSCQADGIVKLNTINNLKAHIPVLNRLTDSLVKTSADRLIQQIEVLDQFLTNNRNEIIGPVIYLAGFSLLEESAYSGNMPSSKLIPWHLLLSDENRFRRIYRQPELSKLLRKLPEDNPNIVNLESIISDMEADPNFD